MTIEKIYLGYWYQRTTLHLSELYDFLRDGTSPLNLDKHKLHELRAQLGITDLALYMDSLEYIELTAHNHISAKLYEDGLILFSKKGTDLEQDIKQLTNYFEKDFTPTISYLFSLGAPVPKELAGVKTISPFFVVTKGATKHDTESILEKLHEKKYLDVHSDKIELYRGDAHFVLNSNLPEDQLEVLIGAHIFFKEFKGQLHHYLNLHRQIWEKIAKIKEQGTIQGRNIQNERNELESYKKSVELIEGRMNQMGIHIGTREAIIKSAGLETTLNDVLQFKYENLRDTLNYVKSLWTMTKGYVDSAIQIFSELNNQSTKNSIQALTLITTLGLLNGIINYFTVGKWPKFTLTGVYYFVFLVVATWLVNELVTIVYRRIRYKINNIQAKKSL